MALSLPVKIQINTMITNTYIKIIFKKSVKKHGSFNMQTFGMPIPYA